MEHDELRKTALPAEETDKLNPGAKEPSEENFHMLKTFGQITSIRGVQKVQRADSRFVRMLWIFFIVSMTFWLISTTIIFIIDFLKFNTVWNIHTKYEDKTEFPSLTICAQNPFSMRAEESWKDDEIQSPKKFVRERFKVISKLLDLNYTDMKAVILMDNTDQYFANLKLAEVIKLSHDISMIPFCTAKKDDDIYIGDKCNFDSHINLTIREFFHPNYFKCHTIEASFEKASIDIQELVMLIRLVPQRDLPEVQNSFLGDTFTRGDGLRVVVHEYKTYPDMDQHGMNLQAGKMNELFFRTYKRVSLKTPINYCTDEVEKIIHMADKYISSSEKCESMQNNLRIIQECKCAITENPVPFATRQEFDDISFCSKLPKNYSVASLEEFRNRLICIGTVLGTPSVHEHCFRRCTQYEYKISASFSVWKPSVSNLHNFKQLYKAVGSDSIEETKRFIKSQIEKDQEENVTADSLLNFEDSHHYTHIRLKRQNFDTIVEEERLVSDISVLISRIGGICSLSIGLTTSFFVEIIEFSYLYITKRCAGSRHPHKPRNV